jgi:hemerythrin-like domain-containing protein
METLKTLIKEHVLIRECLDLLAKAANKITDNEGPPKEFFEKALSFCRSFADTYHHYKEEYTLFGYLAQKKNGDIDAQIESHRSQHERCRDLIQKMSDSLPGYSRQLNESTRALHRNLTDYYQTLRDHIQSENEVFFPMVNKVLSKSEDENLIRQFDKYEKKVGPDVWGINQLLISEMAEMI